MGATPHKTQYVGIFCKKCIRLEKHFLDNVSHVVNGWYIKSYFERAAKQSNIV